MTVCHGKEAKNFLWSELHEANVGYQSSSVCRRLFALRELIEKGTGWCLGAGSNILIRRDSWNGVKTSPTALWCASACSNECRGGYAYKRRVQAVAFGDGFEQL